MAGQNVKCPEKVMEALKAAKKMAEELKAYRELGPVEDIKKVLENTHKFVETFGPFGKLARKLEALKEFEEAVGPLEDARAFLERLYEAAKFEKAQELSEAYGVEVEKVYDLLERFDTPSEVVDFLESVNEGTAPAKKNRKKALDLRESLGLPLDEGMDPLSEQDIRATSITLQEAKAPRDERSLIYSVTKRILSL